ncbi:MULTISPECIES: hypothetical protein [Actinosynnema]|uniref:hypothetical protein n=1 Tax=Actinosynnema TaxID=40566 RepID=UPI0020A2B574|nr:hypothetical protein [Actinosynnema pretiosum]MCP2097370.1 hypothetical protein [Actinosynnema pretiosum]
MSFAQSPAAVVEHRLQPVVVVDEDVPGPIAEFGRAYWRVSGVSLLEGVRWLHRARELALPVPGKPEHVAGLAVRATAPPQHRCAECSGPLVLTSRTAYQRAVLGTPVTCRDCAPRFGQLVRRVRERLPDLAGPTAAAPPADPNRALLHRHYPLTFTPDAPIPAADIRYELLVLGMLRHSTPLPSRLLPAAGWPMPVAPSALAPLWLSLARRDGLLRVHPDSSLKAFHAPGAGGRPEVYDVMLAEHYAPFGRDLADAAATTARLLTARLREADGTPAFREAMRELLEHECLDYAHALLPAPWPDGLGLRIRAALSPVLERTTLGHACAALWQAGTAVRDHLLTEVPDRFAPDPLGWEAGMRRLERAADIATPGGGLKPFEQLRGHPLSAATHALAELRGVPALRLGVDA